MAWASRAAATAYELNRPNREERLRALRERRAKQYLDRKVRQVCVDCEAGLGPDDGVKCELCAGRDAVTKVVYALTPKGRASKKRAQRAYMKRKKKLDICLQCLVPRALWPKPTALQIKRQRVKKPKHCPRCRQEMTDNTREYRRRLRREGVTRMADVRNARRREKLRELRGKNYQPLDELLAKPGVRLMRGMARFDWIECDALFDVLGVPQYDAKDYRDRGMYSQALSRLVRHFGFVERRRQVKARREHIGLRMYEYRLTTAGRAELARLFGRRSS